ncbi:MAG: hypothetical protein AABZ32_08605, partial [Bacteroidota bacterium]
MYEILTTFTEEAQNTARAKCQALGFDTNRGIISLDESFINLNSAMLILTDAIEKQKLIQLPITVQKTILNDLQSISKFLTGLTNGADEVANLVNAIEKFNTTIWQYGFHNLSGEVLGYQTKLNQLKNQELEIIKLKDEVKDGLNIKRKIEKLLEDSDKATQTIQTLTTSSEENAKKIAESLNRTTEADQRTAAILATVQQNESISTQLFASTKTSNAEIMALEGKIKEFYSQVEQYRTKITITTEDAEKAVQNNKIETENLITQLKKLEDQIKVQIQKATGFSLFHSFQTRQEALAKSKRFWVYALSSLVAISIGLTLYVISTTADINVAFYIKLSLSLPIIYAITFCTVQYSRERKLEEEYAFKSNISISLIPYQELVSKLVSNDT